jgi:hypothetical protein
MDNKLIESINLFNDKEDCENSESEHLNCEKQDNIISSRMKVRSKTPVESGLSS